MNAPSSPASSSQGRRWLRRGLIVLIAAGLLHLLTGYLLESRLDAVRSQYQGSSLALADYLPASPPLAAGAPNGYDSLEAAVVLLEGQGVFRPRFGTTPPAHPELQKIADRFRKSGGSGHDLTAAELEGFRATLAKSQSALAILDQAFRDAPEARFSTNLEGVPAEIEIPNLLATLRVSALLRARAEIAWREGRADDAWSDAKNIYRLAYWNATAMNTLIGGLVARANANHADHLVQELLGAAPATAARRAEALAEARRLEPGPLFAKLFAAEKAAMFASLLDPRLKTENIGSQLPRFLVGWKPWLHYNAARYLEWTVAADALCSEPFYQQKNLRGQLEAQRLPDWLEPAATLAFNCADVADKRDLWRASLDQLEIALALESYREARGSYPASLAEACAELDRKLDPFSGKSYRYLPQSSGYRLYSLAANGQDDGGEAGRGDNGQSDPQKGDWVWQVVKQEAN